MQVTSFCSLPVGILRWTAPEPMITVVVKATYSLAVDGEARLAERQDPLSLDVPDPLGDAGSLRVSSDFVPRKAFADVLLVGHARSATPAAEIHARVEVDVLEKSFVARSRDPSLAIPLVARHLRASGAANAQPVVVGPRAAWERFVPVEHGAALPTPTRVDAGFDFAFFNYAPADQRVGLLRPNAELSLTGLVAGAPVRRASLPGSRPRVFAFGPSGPGTSPLEVRLVADTLWIDVDRSVCTLTFRGQTPLARCAEPPTVLVVALEPRGGSVAPWSSYARRLGEAARGPASEPFAAARPAEDQDEDDVEPITSRGTVRISEADAARIAASWDDDGVTTRHAPELRAAALAALARPAPPAPAPPPPPPSASVVGVAVAAPPPTTQLPEMYDDDDGGTRRVSPEVRAAALRDLAAGRVAAAPFPMAPPARPSDAFRSRDLRVPLPAQPGAAIDPLTTTRTFVGAPSSHPALPFRDAAPVAAPRASPAPGEARGAPEGAGADGAQPFLMQLAYWERPGGAATTPASSPTPAPEPAPALAAPARGMFPDDESTALVTATDLGPKLPFDPRAAQRDPGPLAAPELPAPPPVGARPRRREPMTLLAAALPDPGRALPFVTPSAPPSVPGDRLRGDGGKQAGEPPLVGFAPASASVTERAPVEQDPVARGREAAPRARDGREPSPLEEDAPRAPPERSGPLLPLPRYAAIKAAIWGGVARAAVLEEHGLGEVEWLEHERRYADSLAREAEEGGRKLSQAIRAAMADVTSARAAGPAQRREGAISIDLYVTLRAEVETAADPGDVLRARGVSEADWRAARRGFQERARLDKALAAELARKLDDARARLRGAG